MWLRPEGMYGEAFLLRWLKGFGQESNATNTRVLREVVEREWGYVDGFDASLLYHLL
jgi:hypothetical protein